MGHRAPSDACARALLTLESTPSGEATAEWGVFLAIDPDLHERNDGSMARDRDERDLLARDPAEMRALA
jgi:hypothetical protein